VVAISIWQVFLVLVIAAVAGLGGGFGLRRPPDGTGR